MSYRRILITSSFPIPSSSSFSSSIPSYFSTFRPSFFSLFFSIFFLLFLFFPYYSISSPYQTGWVSTIRSNVISPSALTVSPSGDLYYCEGGRHIIGELRVNGTNRYIAGKYDNPGGEDGNIYIARFNEPRGIAILKRKATNNEITLLMNNNNYNINNNSTSYDIIRLFISDSSNHRIRLLIVLDNQYELLLSTLSVQTLAGLSSSLPDYSDGPLLSGAAFQYPRGLSIGRGGLAIADFGNHAIRWFPINEEILTIPLNKTLLNNINVITIAGNGEGGIREGNQSISQLLYPSAVSFPNILSTDTSFFTSNSLIEINNSSRFHFSPSSLFIVHAHSIAHLDSNNNLLTLSGGASPGYFNGNASLALYDGPLGIVADERGDIYISDTANHLIRVLSLSLPGLPVQTLTGYPYSNGGYIDGNPSLAQYDLPISLALYGPPSLFSYLYIGDDGLNNAIRRISAVCFNQCQNNGNCTSLASCTCQQGYKNNDCSAGICSFQCPNGYLCSAPDTCTCPIGYIGNNCTLPLCDKYQCIHGSCIRPNVCSCDQGWKGVNCSIAICSSPCLNGGKCIAPDICSCASGWTGAVCDIPICNLPCQNGAVCIGPNKCNCSIGWSQVDCSIPICDGGCVSGQGNCIGPNHCDCAIGYNGPHCEFPICSPPCLNGTCSSPGICSCFKGYKGNACQSPICNPSCIRGQCIRPDQCLCPSYYTGIDCSTPVCDNCGIGKKCISCPDSTYSSCAGLPTQCISACSFSCGSHGYCNGTNTCNCDSGWSSFDCSIPICHPDTCVHGICIGPDQCRCDPINDWGSPSCSVPLCNPPCQNNGECIEPNHCLCSSSWTGQSCEIPICLFDNITLINGDTTTGCLHNGNCTLPNYCYCNETIWSDNRCSTPVCSPPCIHGNCTSPTDSNDDHICDCFSGYTGLYCETLIIRKPGVLEEFGQFIYIAIGAIIGIIGLIVLWQLRMRFDRARYSRVAYPTEFDWEKEIAREKRKKAKEKAREEKMKRQLSRQRSKRRLKGGLSGDEDNNNIDSNRRSNHRRSRRDRSGDEEEIAESELLNDREDPPSLSRSRSRSRSRKKWKERQQQQQQSGDGELSENDNNNDISQSERILGRERGRSRDRDNNNNNKNEKDDDNNEPSSRRTPVLLRTPTGRFNTNNNSPSGGGNKFPANERKGSREREKRGSEIEMKSSTPSNNNNNNNSE